MVQLTRIYTRGGDKGETSLGDGQRVLKSDTHIQAIGDIDEANSAIGVVLSMSKKTLSSDMQKILTHLQNDLFDLGADLCCPQKETDKQRLRISARHVTAVEESIDRVNENLDPLTSFILPGGTVASAFIHQARTIVRRAERSLILLHEESGINVIAIHYINRLSDLLFVLARHLNHNGKGDVLWCPGKNR